MSAAAAERTIGQSLSWARNMLGYTDNVCASVPLEAYSLRPVDPSGAYMFSAGETIAHLADSRWSVVDWIEGTRHCDTRKFCTEYGGTGKPWQFREAGPQEILDSLGDAGKAIEELFRRPASELPVSTDALVKAHDARIERMRQAGKDTAELEAQGPLSIIDAIIFLVAHEQAHRGALHLMLRSNGVAVARFA